MPNPRQLTLAFFFGVVTLARSAAADDKEEAKVLFEQGLKQMEGKSYDSACPALAQSQKLDPHPGTLFTIAECEALRGHPAAAFARYGEYLQVYASLPRDKQLKQGNREKDARAKRAELDHIVAEATLALPSSAPEGTVVTRDGITLAAAELRSPVQLDPGDHVVTTQAPGGPLTEQRFTLDKGERRTISLEVRPAAPAGPPPPPRPAPRPGTSGRRVAAFVTGGVGAAGLVLGAITGGLMLSKKSAISAGCQDGGGGRELCNTAGASAGDSAKTLGAVASAGFLAGLCGAGVAVVLLATEPRPAKPDAARGRWIEVGALSLGPTGTTVGVRGSF